MALDSKERGRVLTAAFLRPRGLLGVAGGMAASVLLAVVMKWYMLFAGLFVTAGFFAWSVKDSLEDRDFVASMSRPALDADVSHEARLTVLAHGGGAVLKGERRKELERLAGSALAILDTCSKVPAEARGLVEDVPARLRRLVDEYERVAAQAERLAGQGRDVSGQENTLSTIADRISGLADRFQRLGDGASGVHSELAGLAEDLAMIEDASRDIALLED